MKFLYNSNDVYSSKYFLYTYNDNDFRIVHMKSCRNKGFEELKKKGLYDYNSEEVQRVSLSRTRRNIREICLCNDFTYFVTLTVSSEKADRYTLNAVQDKLKKILHKIKRNNKYFKYILITEKHKDNAFHFHGLMGGLEDTTDIYINKFGYLSSHIFDNELGFNSFSVINDYSRCCNYITKYITKDCIKNSHNQVYISSRGLKKATKEEFKNIDFIPSFKNDFCEILDIRLDNLQRKDLIELIFKLKKEK